MSRSGAPPSQLGRSSSQSGLRGAGSFLVGGGGAGGSPSSQEGLRQSRSAAAIGAPASSGTIRAAECKARFRRSGNHKSKFDLPEFTDFLQKCNADITAEECKQLFAKVDKSGAGVIDFDSFVDNVYGQGSRPGSRASAASAAGLGGLALPEGPSPARSVVSVTAPQDSAGGQPTVTRRAVVNRLGNASNGSSRKGSKAPSAAQNGTLMRKTTVQKRATMTRQSSGASDVQQATKKMVLSADCGGTTTRLMLYRVSPDASIERKQRAPGELLSEIKYPNIMFNSLKEIVKVFLSTDCGVANARPAVAVFALAGIVIDGQCRFTNLDWVVNAKEMERDLRIARVELINDFVAQGYGMLTLDDDEVIPLNEGRARTGAPIACIGAGTGLGSCFMVPVNGGEYRCFPSEGQHGEFGPRGSGSDELQLEMLKFLKIKLAGWNRISVERVVSGQGICNVYEFLAHKFPNEVDPDVHKQHQDRKSDASVITLNAKPGSLCEKALRIFASCYGAQVGNMAMWLQPFGGLYVTGGVTKRVQDWMLKDGSFLEAYRDKGRLSPICDQVPLYLVKGDDMGQRGAHLRAVRLLQESCHEQARWIWEESAVNDGDGPVIATLESIQAFLKANNLLGLAKAIQRHYDQMQMFTGPVSFEDFHIAYKCVPTDVFVESFVPDEREVDVRNLEKQALVRPPNRGNSEASRRELAELCMKYDQLRAEYQNHPMFKAMMWELEVGGDPMDEGAWREREFWLTKSGALLFYNTDDGMTSVFCHGKDLAAASIEAIPEGESAKPWAFFLDLPRQEDEDMPERPTTFAASSAAARAVWIEQLTAPRG